MLPKYFELHFFSLDGSFLNCRAISQFSFYFQSGFSPTQIRDFACMIPLAIIFATIYRISRLFAPFGQKPGKGEAILEIVSMRASSPNGKGLIFHCTAKKGSIQ
jgi:hypothetical protein